MVVVSVTSREAEGGPNPTKTAASAFLGASKRKVQPTAADGSLQMQRYLGRGSSAVVSQGTFSCPKNKETKQVAVKQIHTELLDDPQEVRTFVGEVKLLRTLKHPYIVEFYGCSWSKEMDEEAEEEHDSPAHPRPGQHLYFLQEYMEGATLHQLVLRAMTSQTPWKVYSDADALRWALQIAMALEYCHSREPKVIHRDLKLENLLLSSTKPSQANAKLSDFGLARALHPCSGEGVGKGLGSADKGPRWKLDHAELLGNTHARPERLDHFQRVTSTELERSLNFQFLDSEQEAPSRLGAGGTEAATRTSSGGLARVGEGGEDADAAHRAADLTARTGSMGYMPPEVLLGKPYNEKADVFSFAICLYNLFHRNIPTVHICLNGDIEDLELYANNVAHGYRPALEKRVLAAVRALIERCWKGLPELRPSMSEVVAELERIQAEHLLEVAEATRTASNQPSKGCCTIM